MPEPEAPSYVLTLVILLSSCLGVSGLLLIMSFRIFRRLGRMERQLADRKVAVGAASDSNPMPVETAPGSTFEEFLSEDAARREMTKGEQFAAYRQWRQDRGMNWSNS